MRRGRRDACAPARPRTVLCRGHDGTQLCPTRSQLSYEDLLFADTRLRGRVTLLPR